jgi:hypothetical protein
MATAGGMGGALQVAGGTASNPAANRPAAAPPIRSTTAAEDDPNADHWVCLE